MKVLFKSSENIYFLNNNDELFFVDIRYFERPYGDINLSNIPHLDDAKILYYYKDTKSGERFPVYYEHNGRFISENAVYTLWDFLIKDYTLVNLKLL